jgi:hypothetical protein
MTRSLTVLRDCGPYVLIELLLPGGTLVALLLWLSRRFMRGGLDTVRQHTFRRALHKATINAKPHPHGRHVCTCEGHTTVLSASSRAFAQSCARMTAPACCTTG